MICVLIFNDDYSSDMFKISIQHLFSSAESLILVCQERSDAETARRMISQTFIYRPCAAPCQQSQYLLLHNFILYVTADSGRPYIWAMHLWRVSFSVLVPFILFSLLYFCSSSLQGVFSVTKRQHPCEQSKIHKEMVCFGSLLVGNNLTKTWEWIVEDWGGLMV